MMSKDKIDFISILTNNWQILTFIVIFLGYITIFFYLNLNGFSFIEINIKHIIGLGILVSIFIIWILFASTTYNSYPFFIFNAYFPVIVINLLNYINYTTFIISIIGGTILGTFVISNINNKNYENELEKNKAQSQYDNLFILFLIPLILTLEINYALLFIVNLVFLWSFQKIYLLKKYFNPFQILSFLLIVPFTLALIINNNGFKISNFDKKNISFIANDKNISGILIYQNTNSFFIQDNNNSIEIQKDDITSDIHYTNYDYKKEIIINIVSKYLSKFTLEHNKTLEDE